MNLIFVIDFTNCWNRKYAMYSFFCTISYKMTIIRSSVSGMLSDFPESEIFIIYCIRNFMYEHKNIYRRFENCKMMNLVILSKNVYTYNNIQ